VDRYQYVPEIKEYVIDRSFHYTGSSAGWNNILLPLNFLPRPPQ
jgi:hypothetical protein